MTRTFLCILANFLLHPLFAQTVVSDSLLSRHVAALAHDSMRGRFTGRGEIHDAAKYIAGQMELSGLKTLSPGNGAYIIPWKAKRKMKVEGAHVIGIVPGSTKKDKIIVFSAHYDHIGTWSSQKAMPFGSAKNYVKNDSIYNGANDNATGVAALLELARLFSRANPSYTLLFVAFSGEELGLLGSADFLENQVQPSAIRMNINLEMLGRPYESSPYVVEKNEETHMLRLLNRHLNKSGADYPKDFFVADPYPEQSLFTRSDHYSFHKAGIDAFTIMATDPEDEFYHSAKDEWPTIQFSQMQRIVQAIYLALLPLTRVDGM